MKEINTTLSIAITILIIFGTSILSVNNREVNSSVITIEKGMSLNSVSNLLLENEIIVNQNIFKLKVITRGLASKIPTGRFLIDGKISDAILIDLIFNKGPIKLKLTIPEGSQSKNLFKDINTLLNTDYDFNKYFNSTEILEQYKVDASSLEGYLYPDTYYLYHDSSPEEIIDILLSEFWKKFDENLQDRANQLGFSVHEVVTLASIIEGEAMLDSERSTISSVYHNRLKINMKLQADPTIQYIIPGPPKTLSNRDLRIESDYNTYQNYGLPPGPINNPGIASIKAALYPEDTNFLFFVAQGDGSHAFTTNEKDHEEAKKIYKINKRKNR
ncbi:MAG: endolytic transglycosylase MltG [Candidatus Marinimicrobia bacterium]|nr:endolytic transglycosylase MltG [Candidatus Neomarinimicrobiota bacterium]MDA1363212.1 endolytic transglycosylase MltG [Candidatus Neomarinimicrobiota bacterium]